MRSEAPKRSICGPALPSSPDDRGPCQHDDEQTDGSMNLQRLNFLLLAAMMSALSTPASAQAVPPAVGSVGSITRGVASIPDFSGTWAHPYLTGFEPPASGPGPVRNRSRRPDGVANFNQLVGDFTNPILQPWAAEVVKTKGELSLGGQGYPTPSNQCWPGGVPYVFWDFLMQMWQQGDRITMLYRHGNEVRHVRMNQSHPAHVAPTWYGDSVGHYEGAALVIDTIGIKVGPFAMVDMYGTPHTEALHVTERYRLIDYAAAQEAIARNDKENFRVRQDGFDPDYRGKVLQLEFTVEDPGAFTTPWSSLITYRRSFNEWTDLICAENRHEYYGGVDSAVPTAVKP